MLYDLIDLQRRQWQAWADMVLTSTAAAVALAPASVLPAVWFARVVGALDNGEVGLEDAVRRETAEEAGIELGRVRYHSSQPWPFPCSLMIGCHGEALTTDITRDEVELEDARWFPRGEVRSILAGTHASIKCPPPIAIAHGLIRYWAEGR